MQREVALVEMIAQALERRTAANPAYSLRALARDSGVSASRLSEFLSGKRMLSPKNLKAVMAGLRIEVTLQERALLMARIHAAKTPRQKLILRRELGHLERGNTRFEVSLQNFAYHSNWLHFAVLELLSWPRTWNEVELSQHLNVELGQVKLVLKRLLVLGLVQRKSGQLCASTSQTEVKGGAPSEAIRAFHSELIQKSLKAVEGQSISERHLRSMIFSLTPEDYGELTKRIRSFFEEVASRASPPNAQSRLYALTLQLFSLDQGARL